jgi:NADH dehydrogenase
VLLDEVTGSNSVKRVVHLKQGELSYDFLVLATGIQYNYFGHDEWRQFAPGLESLDDADVIRGKILLAFERAEEMASMEHAGSEEIRRQLTFALVGAGTVGVEMASTLAEMSRMALARDFRHIDPTSARILLYEAAPRILPTYPEGLSVKAQRHLERLGIEVYTNARVNERRCGRDHSRRTENSGRHCTLGSWCACVSGGALARRRNRQVREDPRRARSVSTGHEEVLAIGDTAHVVAPARNLLGIGLRNPMVMPGSSSAC